MQNIFTAIVQLIIFAVLVLLVSGYAHILEKAAIAGWNIL